MIQRSRILVTGTVQGVGFRPFIATLAKHHNLSGYIYNETHGATIEIQGTEIDSFLIEFQKNLPLLARIDHFTLKKLNPIENEKNFTIKQSQFGEGFTKIPADTATCEDCLQDLFNKDSHYYLYPFTSCTQCGPRVSTTKQLPFDRAHTTFHPFIKCPHCQSAYLNPKSRRYHAQTIACCHCGPRLSYSVCEISEKIKGGKIVAVKSLSGYQIILDAQNADAIHRLRVLKKRPTKPFALMALNTISVKQWAKLSDESEQLLRSSARPIVLLNKKIMNEMQFIAPNLSYLGMMLPATPLHYLIFYYLLSCPQGNDWLTETCPFVLVVTSGNNCNHPIIKADDEARITLKKCSDLIVSYNRDIVMRADDSIMQVIAKKKFFIRRARGFIPEPIPLPQDSPPVLALGGILKNTFCLIRNQEAFVSQHIGDLNNIKSIQVFCEAIEHWKKILNIQPEYIVIDKHPDYYGAYYAYQHNLPILSVQHHHAHLAQVAAEHHITEPALGLTLDGYGYGNDHQAWGGELLFYKGKDCKRLGHLQPLSLVGGDRASRACWRMGISLLYTLKKNQIERFASKYYSDYPWKAVIEILDKKVSLLQTTSCGRWFDGVSSLLGVCHTNHYEGEAAMRLESLVTDPKSFHHGWRITNNILYLTPLMKYLLNCDPVIGANYFHGTLIAALSEWLITNLEAHHLQHILLSGGCFSNQILTQGLYQRLTELGYHVYLSQKVPVNDGGLSLGQAWLGALEWGG